MFAYAFKALKPALTAEKTIEFLDANFPADKHYKLATEATVGFPDLFEVHHNIRITCGGNSVCPEMTSANIIQYFNAKWGPRTQESLSATWPVEATTALERLLYDYNPHTVAPLTKTDALLIHTYLCKFYVYRPINNTTRIRNTACPMREILFQIAFSKQQTPFANYAAEYSNWANMAPKIYKYMTERFGEPVYAESDIHWTHLYIKGDSPSDAITIEDYLRQLQHKRKRTAANDEEDAVMDITA